MGRYGDLVKNVENKFEIYKKFQDFTSKILIKTLSQNWECAEGCFEIDFKKPTYTKRNDIVTWPFSLTIIINNSTPEPFKFSLNDFSLIVAQVSRGAYSRVNYHNTNYNLDDPIADLIDIVFHDIYEIVDQDAWL